MRFAKVTSAAIAAFLAAACAAQRYDPSPKAVVISDNCPTEKAIVAALDAEIAKRVDTARAVEAAHTAAIPASFFTMGLAGAAVGLSSSLADYDTTSLREERAVWRAVAIAKGCAVKNQPQMLPANNKGA